MSRYVLTKRLYNTMTGRGYKLVCRICKVPLQKGDLIESKPSKYQNWECDRCQVTTKSGKSKAFSTKTKPKARVPMPLERKGLPKCWRCGGPMHYVGRKFYHADCYDDMHVLVVSSTTTTITVPPRGVLEND